MFKLMCRFHTPLRRYSKEPLILGIETSCDDTAAAVMKGRSVLSDVVNSQQSIHLRSVPCSLPNPIVSIYHPGYSCSHCRYGGIIPPIAQDLHRQNIEEVVRKSVSDAGIQFSDLDAIAVTNRPGLPLSLKIGLRYAKYLCRTHKKPLIPVHHMKGHALTVRITKSIPFPYLCLLISGGHSLLTYVKTASEFQLLGDSLDDAPGELFDKIARDLKLRNLPGFQDLSGGAAIEKATYLAENKLKFDYPLPLSRYRDCQFSYSGLKNTARRHLLEQENGLAVDEVIPCYADYCASLLCAVTRHICHRTQRAIEFCESEGDFFASDSSRSFVVSGGVACNDFIFNALAEMAAQFGFTTVRPEKRHCTDNGVMIAWTGVENYRLGLDVVDEEDFQKVTVEKRVPLGLSLIDRVKQRQLACKWAKISLLQE